MKDTVNIEDIKKNDIVETCISRSRGKVNKSLTVRTEIISQKVSFVVVKEGEESIFFSAAEAVKKYNVA